MCQILRRSLELSAFPIQWREEDISNKLLACMHSKGYSTWLVCVCVCVCVCGGENKRGRKESMGERDVATETGGGGGGGDLSASSKHRTAGHTLMLGMDSQTIVCLIILCLLYTFFRVGRQGSSPSEYH